MEKINTKLKSIKNNEFDDLPKRFRTQFINSLSGFKSVNLVGTSSDTYGTNLSIISSVIHLGANPSLMGFIMRPASVPRHTYENILETGSYTFNHIHPSFFAKAHQTAARYPKGTSEFGEVGLTPEYVDGIVAPFVQESTVKIGMKFLEEKKIELNNTILIIGEVQQVIFPEDCLMEDGFLDLEKAGTITCGGLDSYHTTTRLSRLSYAKPNKIPSEIA